MAKKAKKTRGEEYPKPLTFAQVKRLSALQPEVDSPGRVMITVGTFRLPEAARATIVPGCTIGSRLLLTASHAIQWNADGTAGWVRFRPSYYNGSAPFGEAWATRVISWMKADGSSGLTDHFNDIVGGHSGGPVWDWWSNEGWPRVVGTQSAEAAVPANNTSGDNEFGGGPALSSLISWARSNYA